MPEPILMRVEAGALPSLIAAYQNALNDMTPLLADLDRNGRVAVAWTNDPHTATIRGNFNQWAMDAPDSVYASLVLYKERLADVVSQLHAMHAAYTGAEATATEGLPQQ